MPKWVVAILAVWILSAVGVFVFAIVAASRKPSVPECPDTADELLALIDAGNPVDSHSESE